MHDSQHIGFKYGGKVIVSVITAYWSNEVYLIVLGRFGKKEQLFIELGKQA